VHFRATHHRTPPCTPAPSTFSAQLPSHSCSLQWHRAVRTSPSRSRLRRVDLPPPTAQVRLEFNVSTAVVAWCDQRVCRRTESVCCGGPIRMRMRISKRVRGDLAGLPDIAQLLPPEEREDACGWGAR
jgi:hypothetical protein